MTGLWKLFGNLEISNYLETPLKMHEITAKPSVTFVWAARLKITGLCVSCGGVYDSRDVILDSVLCEISVQCDGVCVC